MQLKTNKKKKHFLRLIKLKIPQIRHVYKSTIAQHPNTNALPGNKYTHAHVQVCLWGTGGPTGSCGQDALEDARFRPVRGGAACPTGPGGSVSVPGPEESPHPPVDHPETPDAVAPEPRF